MHSIWTRAMRALGIFLVAMLGIAGFSAIALATMGTPLDMLLRPLPVFATTSGVGAAIILFFLYAFGALGPDHIEDALEDDIR